MNNTTHTFVPIKAIFNGVQQAAEPFELWTILEPMGEHPAHSTVSGETIARHGRVPTIVDNQED